MCAGLRRSTNYPSPAQWHGHGEYSELLHQNWTLDEHPNRHVAQYWQLSSAGRETTPACDLRRTLYDLAIEFVCESRACSV
jgi:hypothetical protein